MFGKTDPKSIADEAANLPPATEWRVPPLGSLGDAWDKVVVLPPQLTDEPPTPRRAKVRPNQKRKRPDEVLFRDYAPKLHISIVIGWLFLGLALASTGPAYPLMPLLALVGLLLSLLGGTLLKTIHREKTGFPFAVSGTVLGLALILLDAWRPENPAYDAVFLRPLAGSVTVMGHDEKISFAVKTMDIVADAAYCTHRDFGADLATAVGRNSVNGGIDGRSESFAISTLASPEFLASLGRKTDMLIYAPGQLPPDPFADDARATYGVYITQKHIIVYSIGPDGVWQINPRNPVKSDSTDPEKELAQHQYGLQSGPNAPGDIIRVYRLEDDSREVFCEETRTIIEEKEW